MDAMPPLVVPNGQWERLARLYGPADTESIDACAGRYSDQVVRNPMVLGRATYSP